MKEKISFNGDYCDSCVQKIPLVILDKCDFCKKRTPTRTIKISDDGIAIEKVNLCEDCEENLKENGRTE